MSTTDYGDARLFAGARTGWRQSSSRMSWGAVVAGAVVAAATMLLLSFLGVSIGAGALRLSQTTAADWRSYGLGAGIWTAVNLILSMAFGGYVAARLSGTHSHLDGELHGITVWAVATLLATLFLAQLASLAIGTVTGPGPAAAATAEGPALQVNPQSLLDRLQQSLTSSGDPTQMTRDQIRNEISVLTLRRVSSGDLTAPDRDRLTTLVAAQAGVTREEAARRVARMEQNAAAALAQARSAAETAAASAALGAKAVFSALLLGLGAAMLGAWVGTRHARVLAPYHEPRYETHTATYATRTVYTEPPLSTSAHVHEDTAPPVPPYLRAIPFPASKQELLRAARAANDEPVSLRRLEQIPDRSYSSLDDLMSVLFATA